MTDLGKLVDVSDFDARAEYIRQGALEKGDTSRFASGWRVSDTNVMFACCATYPRFLVVPAALSDTSISDAAQWRSMERIPALTWFNRRTGAPLCRSSQPKVGIWRDMGIQRTALPEDEALLLAMRHAAAVARTRIVRVASGDGGAPHADGVAPSDTAFHAVASSHGPMLRIVDARPFINAKANAAMGKGHECVSRLNAVSAPEHAGTTLGALGISGDGSGVFGTATSSADDAASSGADASADAQHHEHVTLEFLGIANIHAMRESLVHLRDACSGASASASAMHGSLRSPGGASSVAGSLAGSLAGAADAVEADEPGGAGGGAHVVGAAESSDAWMHRVADSKWLNHLTALLRGAVTVAGYLEAGDAVLVHCSDGWDRTAQICALAQFLLDPYYRTIEGFRVLVEKDWCSFGFMFRQRAGLNPDEGPDEMSPIFLQWLDAIWQVCRQFPSAAEFSDELLLFLADAAHSRFFSNFLHDCDADRIKADQNEAARKGEEEEGEPGARAARAAVSVWACVRHDLARFSNPLYASGDQRDDVLWPSALPADLELWRSALLGERDAQSRAGQLEALVLEQQTKLKAFAAALAAADPQAAAALEAKFSAAPLEVAYAGEEGCETDPSPWHDSDDAAEAVLNNGAELLSDRASSTRSDDALLLDAAADATTVNVSVSVRIVAEPSDGSSASSTASRAPDTTALAPEDATFEIESKRHLPVSWLRCEVATRWRRGRTPPAPSATTAPEPPGPSLPAASITLLAIPGGGGGAIPMAPDSSIGDALDEAHAVVTTGGGTGTARVVAVASPGGDWTASVLSLLGATSGATSQLPEPTPPPDAAEGGPRGTSRQI